MNYERARKCRGTHDEILRDLKWDKLREQPGATIADACNLWMHEDAPFVPVGSDFPYHYLPDYGEVVRVPVPQKLSYTTPMNWSPVAPKFELVHFRKSVWGFSYRRKVRHYPQTIHREYRWVRE